MLHFNTPQLPASLNEALVAASVALLPDVVRAHNVHITSIASTTSSAVSHIVTVEVHDLPDGPIAMRFFDLARDGVVRAVAAEMALANDNDDATDALRSMPSPTLLELRRYNRLPATAANLEEQVDDRLPPPAPPPPPTSDDPLLVVNDQVGRKRSVVASGWSCGGLFYFRCDGGSCL
jgi:hypothetical protein